MRGYRQTVIADADGVYHPSLISDRMPLSASGST